jgi:hypothetical protein
MPDHHRRVAIALMTRWFEQVQVGGAFNDTIFAIFSKDSPLGRFADGEMISFDEETLLRCHTRLSAPLRPISIPCCFASSFRT